MIQAGGVAFDLRLLLFSKDMFLFRFSNVLDKAGLLWQNPFTFGKRGDQMSKRQEIRERRKREKIRNRFITIGLVVVGALLIAFALVIPSINNVRNAASATQTAQFTTPSPVIVITPNAITAQVNGVHLGDPNAPVKVDVYEDFRCSACKYYADNVEPQVIQTYVETGKVYYTYHTFITIDSYDNTTASYQSANAALCAADQGHFWDYHETLFANQITEDASLFTDARLTAMAQNLGLDMAAFNQCFQAKRHASEIQNDITQGDSLSIRGTPSTFVNGTYVAFSDVVAAIDAALAGQ